MKRRWLFLALALLTAVLAAEEGMFMINGLTPKMVADMKKLGFQLDAKDIWDGQGNGLAAAVVSFGGGTGSFVSAKGLIITNHHVAFGAVQRQSTPEHNYIREGFLAESPAQEIPAPGYTVYVLTAMDDVTPLFARARDPNLTPLQRYQQVDKISKRLITTNEQRRGVECRISQYYGGKLFIMLTYLKIRDIRIVYVPPRSIGEYGGEVDNWMWPRHTGDFSFLRAYVGPDGLPADFAPENVPFTPTRFLRIAQDNLQENAFTMIMGFPGRTERWYSAAEVGNDVTFNYPQRIKLLEEWIALLEEVSQASELVKIKNAGVLKGLYNTIKNSRGMLEGLQKTGLYEKKLAAEKKLLEKVSADANLKKLYGSVIPEMNQLNEEVRAQAAIATVTRYLLTRGCYLMSWALNLNKWAIERQKPNMERDTGFMERDFAPAKERQKVAQRALDIPTDKKVLAFFIAKLAELPKSGLANVFDLEIARQAGVDRQAKVAAFVEGLYAGSRLAELDFRLKMLDSDQKTLYAQNDAFINLARRLQVEMDLLEEKQKTIAGRQLLLKPLYTDLLMKANPGKNYYPDANGTMRFSYGQVKGYSPRDAICYSPFTTLKGVIEKDSGQDPFDLDPRLSAVYQAGDYQRYVVPGLNDVPVNFITTNDSTGGNSGSPVLNGKGELVGVLFDGNYEALSSDFFFQPDITRSIHVDIRYVLFVTEMVNKADNVLRELAGE